MKTNSIYDHELKVWDTGALEEGWKNVGTLSTETETAYVRRYPVEKQYYKASWIDPNDKRFYCHIDCFNTILFGIDTNQFLLTDTEPRIDGNDLTYEYTARPDKYIEEFLIKELNIKPSGRIYIRKYEMAIDIGVKRHKLLEALEK